MTWLLPLLNAQDQKMFIWLDFMNNGLFIGIWYWYVWKELPRYIPVDKTKKFERMRETLLLLFIIQWCLSFFSNLCLSFDAVPCLLHKNSQGLSLWIGVLFVTQLVLRFLMLFTAIAFLFVFLSTEDKIIRQVLWSSVFILIGGLNLYSITYYVWPQINEGLVIYDTFYRIRNLFIDKEPQKQQKIKCILAFLGKQFPDKLSPYLKNIYEKQWACTFRNELWFF